MPELLVPWKGKSCFYVFVQGKVSGEDRDAEPVLRDGLEGETGCRSGKHCLNDGLGLSAQAEQRGWLSKEGKCNECHSSFVLGVRC